MKLLAYFDGFRSGTRMQTEGLPRWLGEHQCGIRIDAEEHWWWMRGFDAGYYLHDPAEDLSKLNRSISYSRFEIIATNPP